MEIKKYVLLDDKRIVEIYGKTKFGYEYVDSKTENGIVVTRTILEDKIIKSSDNILALATKDDMIEYVRKSGKIDRYFILVDEVTDLRNGEVEQKHDDILTQIFDFNKEHNTKMYLYKKQPNGDYKRYEVKENV
jgi:hypothetical protein